MRGEGDPAEHPLLRWLMGDEARATVTSLAARRRLGHLADDVLGDVVVAAMARVRGAPGWVPENPAAYGTRMLRNAMSRLLGAARPVDPLDGLDPAEEEVVVVEPPDELLDETRATIEALGGPAWLVSGTLTLLTLGVEGVEPPVGLPSPQGGSTPEQARCWPALALAGEHDLFPGGDGDPPARRRRRARRIDALRERLRAAVAASTGRSLGSLGGGGRG